MKWRGGRVAAVAVLILTILLAGHGGLGMVALADAPRQNLVMLRRVSASVLTPPDPPGAIKGMVYQDWTEDGLHDPFEPPLAGANVVLMDRAERELASQMTGTDGTFCFEGVAPGVYIVVEIDPPGYSSTGPGQFVVYVGPNQVHEISFGDILRLT